MAALIIAIFPQNSSRGNWEEQQDRTDPNSQFELARKPAWLLAFRQFGLPKWKHDFESCSHLALSCLLWPLAAVLETAKTLVLQRILDAPAGIDQLHIRKNQSSN